MMKWRYLLLGILGLCLTACKDNPPKPKVQDIQGNVINFADLKGKWVILNYWASWCKPCIKEIPELNKFYQAYKEKDVLVLGINFDALSPEQLMQAVKNIGITYPVLVSDPGKQLGIGNIDVVPVSYVINPEGKLLPPLLGEQTEESLKQILRQ